MDILVYSLSAFQMPHYYFTDVCPRACLGRWEGLGGEREGNQP